MHKDDLFKRDFEGREHDMFNNQVERQNKIKDRRIEIDLANQYRKNGKVLDIGAGTGLFFEGLREFNELHAIELSSVAARYLKEKFNAEVRQIDVLDADYEPNYFDVINMTYVIEHLKQPRLVMEKVISWLKPNGLLLVSSPNWQSPMARIYREFFRLNDPCQHINLWDPSTLTEFLEDIGVAVNKRYFPYFRTEYFCGYELSRLVTNTLIRLLLPVLVRVGIYPDSSRVISPPFWGSIMVIESYKK
jgi:SAM-dependent methyltransferase